MTSLTVPARFCGPPGTANGGYLAGSLAARVAAPAVSVRLRRPVPLDRELTLRTGDALELLDGQELLARAEPAALDLEVPEPPTVTEAAAAVSALPPWDDHPFPGCWGCGTERAADEGLRSRVGPLPDRPQVWAGVLQPAGDVPSSGGQAAPETVWAALDCPSFQPLAGSGPSVLGTMTARQDRPVPLGADLVLMAWVLGRDGRRSVTASALVGPDGQVAARAEAIWFAVG
ncbi:hypothetical protein [Geodermatophilus ruber]|uniref:Acyl-CoA thioesterase n=1 Tax=Geodermatophilus ruber TaxID=504800 RepID=A0A1I3ZCM6_9ACTN|nr:hypothetical protein [Geodermatophilus ruber]SFK41938.1 hypothetical protein SAMN04488085_101480 [Geodermatophilus ruber]